jgi:hypothetical protein
MQRRAATLTVVLGSGIVSGATAVNLLFGAGPPPSETTQAEPETPTENTNAEKPESTNRKDSES